MPSATTRLSLVEPLSTDATTEYRTAITTNATSLDRAVLITEGTLSARPTSSLVYGQTYYATDTKAWYFYDGTNWNTVYAGGGWNNIVLTTGIGLSAFSGSFYTPAYRIVGDTVQLSGSLKSSGNLSTGQNLGAFPLMPALSSDVVMGTAVLTSTGMQVCQLQIDTGTAGLLIGFVSGAATITQLGLDGLSFRLT